ncbi:hypothetical protein YB2330_004151 [Saitoella coloradoensis]
MARTKRSNRRPSGSLTPHAKPRPQPSTSEKTTEHGESKAPLYGAVPKSPPLTDPVEKVTVEAGTAGGENKKRMEEDTTSSGSSVSDNEGEGEDGKNQDDIGSELFEQVKDATKAKWVSGDSKIGPVEEYDDDDDDEDEEEEEDWADEGEAKDVPQEVEEEAENTLASRLGPTPDRSPSGDEAGVEQRTGVTKEDPGEVDDDDDDDDGDDDDLSGDQQPEREEAKALAGNSLASRLGPTPPHHSHVHSPIDIASDASSSPSSSTLEHEHEAEWNSWDTALRSRHQVGRGIGKRRVIGAWTNCRVPKEKWTPGVRKWVEMKVTQRRME